MSILFTFGVNDRDTARIMPDSNGQPFFHVDGISRVMDRVDLEGVDVQMLLIYGPGAKQPLFNLSKRPSLIFNQISDADSHGTALRRCSELCRRVGVPVINHPEAVMQTARDSVHEALRDIPGITSPKTVRFNPRSTAEVIEAVEKEGMGFPVLVRPSYVLGGRPSIV